MSLPLAYGHSRVQLVGNQVSSIHPTRLQTLYRSWAYPSTSSTASSYVLLFQSYSDSILSLVCFIVRWAFLARWQSLFLPQESQQGRLRISHLLCISHWSPSLLSTRSLDGQWYRYQTIHLAQNTWFNEKLQGCLLWSDKPMAYSHWLGVGSNNTLDGKSLLMFACLKLFES